MMIKQIKSTTKQISQTCKTSQNFNRINAKKIKNMCLCKIYGFQNVKLAQKIYVLFLYKGAIILTCTNDNHNHYFIF